ncbi:hypothetical protein D3C76_1840340 [compost metagenome]
MVVPGAAVEVVEPVFDAEVDSEEELLPVSAASSEVLKLAITARARSFFISRLLVG